MRRRGPGAHTLCDTLEVTSGNVSVEHTSPITPIMESRLRDTAKTFADPLDYKTERRRRTFSIL